MSKYKMVDDAVWCTTCKQIEAQRYTPHHRHEPLYRKVPDVCGTVMPDLPSVTCDVEVGAHSTAITSGGRRVIVHRGTLARSPFDVRVTWRVEV